MSAAPSTANLRPVLIRLLAATLMCAAVAVPSAVAALDEPMTRPSSLTGALGEMDNGWPAPAPTEGDNGWPSSAQG